MYNGGTYCRGAEIMVYIIFLAILMVFIVAYLMLGGVSLIKNDDAEQDQIDKEVRAALLK